MKGGWGKWSGGGEKGKNPKIGGGWPNRIIP